MQKTKLGISVGLLGAIIYFLGLFGGYQAVILVAGYVLLREEDIWLRKLSVKAVVLLLTFSVAISAIGLIPDLFDWVSSVIALVNINISFSFLTKLVRVVTGAISIIRTVLFLVLGLQALGQEDIIRVDFADALVEKHMQ